MFCGLIGGTSFDIQYRLNLSGTVGTHGHWTAQLLGLYVQDYIALAGGIVMAAESKFLFPVLTTSGLASLDIPALGISQTSSYTAGPCAQICEFLGVKIYAMNSGTWRIKVATVNWYVNGSLVYHNAGAWTIDSGVPIHPSAIPIFGIPPYLTIGGGTGSRPAIGCHIGGAIASDGVTAQVTGGFQWRPAGGSYYAAPIAIPPLTTIAGEGTVGGTTTWNATITMNESVSGDASSSQDQLGLASIQPVPNLPRAVVRMNQDYEACVFRYGFPEVPVHTFHNYAHFDCPGNPLGDSNRQDTKTACLPELSQFLAGVKNSGHIIEAPMAFTVYSPCSVTLYKNINNVADWSQENWGSSFGPDLLRPADNPDLASYLLHRDPTFGYLAVYNNTWANPHWSSFLWFPPDGAAAPQRWPINGTPAPIAYWLNNRQQFMSNVALPPGENTKHRVNVLTEPLDQGGLVGTVEAVSGLPSWWWGIDRFEVDTPDSYPSSFLLTTASSSRWSWPGGAGSVAAGGITLNAGTTAVRFNLGSWTTTPYNAPLVSDRVTLTWTDPNISSVNVYLEGYDGTKTLIGTASGTDRFLEGLSTKWMTTAACDFGATYIADTYVGIASAGADGSSATINDERRNVEIGYNPSRMGQYLRVELVAVNPALPCVLLHPTFLMADPATTQVVAEIAPIATRLCKDGPVNRYGTDLYWNPLSDALLSDPLVVNPINRMPTMGDSYAHENSFFLGVDAQTNIGLRLAARYENGVEYTIDKHAWRDDLGQLDTHSFVCKGNGRPVVVSLNSYRAVPPLGMFPELERTQASDWKATGSYCQKSYSLIANTMVLLGPGGSNPRLLNSGGANVLSPYAVPHGHDAGAWTPILSGSEGYDYKIEIGAVKLASVRPWRGYYAMFGKQGESNPWHIQRADGWSHWASIVSGDVWVKTSVSPVPVPGWRDVVQVTSFGDCTHPRLRFDIMTSRLMCWFSRPSGEVWESVSDDDGRTWSTPAHIL